MKSHHKPAQRPSANKTTERYKHMPHVETGHTLYYGTFVHTPVLGKFDIFTDSGVLVNNFNGVIEFMEIDRPLQDILMKYNIPETSVVDISNRQNAFFFPGFIDTHIHAPQYPNTGIFGNSTLLDWLTTYTFPLEASMSDLKRARKVYEKVIKKTLENGTTCASYYATIDSSASNLLADLALEHGQKAFIGKVCMNRNSPEYYCETFDESKKSTMEVINHINKIDPNHEMVAPILTPRFAPSCTSELLKWLGDLREEHDLHCQTHVSENKDEVQLVRDLFPDSASYTDVYKDHNLLGERTILAHAVHLSDHERDIIRDSGTGISHCPISNSALTSGEARIRWMLDNGIKVGLGSDVSGGSSVSILQVAKQALLVSRHLSMSTEDENDKLSVEDVLYLATMGGAQLCSLEKETGSFDLGKKWDVQLVDLDAPGTQVEIFDWQTTYSDDDDFIEKWENLLAKWLFNGDDRNSAKVWVNGRQVK